MCAIIIIFPSFSNTTNDSASVAFVDKTPRGTHQAPYDVRTTYTSEANFFCIRVHRSSITSTAFHFPILLSRSAGLSSASKMRVHFVPLAALLLLISHFPSFCCSGFSATTPKPNQRRKGKDFTAQVVEDLVVKDVSAKFHVNKKSTTHKLLNTRQKSFFQRDPIISLNMNLDYLAKSGQQDAAKRCEELLLRIEALHDDGYYERSPDVVSYNSVINAYAQGRSFEHSRIENAKRLMKRMEDKGLRPNTITWNTLLRCILKEIGDKKLGASSKDNVRESEAILSLMEETSIANTVSYNTVISIISKSGTNDAAERAEGWLRRMLTLYEATKNEKIQPDSCSFNSVIHAYASAHKNSSGAPKRARRAEELLNQMGALFRSGGYDTVKPDVISFGAVINAYSRAAMQEKTCAVRAMEILERIEELYEGGDKDLKPNLRTYTGVINAFARIGSPEKADLILSKLKKGDAMGDKSLKPDTICYSSVLDAYAKKGGEEAAYRAEELLHEMEDLYRNGDKDVKPNTHTYRAVITALGRSRLPRAAEKAEQILDKMIDISSQGYKDLAPNTIIYNAVIDAFARSYTVSKAHRAELLLERMLEETEKGNTSIRPDTITFNSVINAAVRSSSDDVFVRKEAFLIALQSFRHVHSLDYCRPSSITYVSYLKLLEKFVGSGDNRDSMAERVFRLSVSHGLATDAVKAQLRKTCSPLVAQRIASSCENDIENRQ